VAVRDDDADATHSKLSQPGSGDTSALAFRKLLHLLNISLAIYVFFVGKR
jgi:hypothetical protein